MVFDHRRTPRSPHLAARSMAVGSVLTGGAANTQQMSPYDDGSSLPVLPLMRLDGHHSPLVNSSYTSKKRF